MSKKRCWATLRDIKLLLSKIDGCTDFIKNAEELDSMMK